MKTGRREGKRIEMVAFQGGLSASCHNKDKRMKFRKDLHEVLCKECDENQEENEQGETLKKGLVARGMVWSLKKYKQVISPMIPPACRFIPTCSEYAILSVQQYGPLKAAILIPWRLFRCSPIGGFGYDPPCWPPPHFRAPLL
mmetsp:Transcript_7390/g.13341  ORF Transcript_7390/g.13341 Transcript_7390/m.13341 type:complete len:143 (+) Transcript_7390:701-1129(+)